MVRVSGAGVPPGGAAGILAGLKVQPTVASGRLLQAKVMGTVVVPLVGVTLKVEVADCPESAVAGVGGVVMVKVGGLIVWVRAGGVLPALFASPPETAGIECG